jgi:riboflavin kinase/FMN adenylyltransferase
VDIVRIWNGIEAYRDSVGPVVATLGNYDGVHLGHRAIIRSVIEDARRRSVPALLISFVPHPLEVLAPERRPLLLQTRRQKMEALEATGLDGLLLLDFTPETALLSGPQFVAGLLADGLELAAVHVGENFRFGHARAGTLEVLRRVGAECGFAVCGLPPVSVDGSIVSSSAIRAAVAAGDVARARALLGRPFCLSGEITRGDGRGRDLGFPTANVDADNEIIPATGVYITRTHVLASTFSSVTNVGRRPTFGGQGLTVESHLLDFDDDIYEERVAVEFLERLREEARFSEISQLADQIARDRAAAESYFMNQRIGS